MYHSGKDKTYNIRLCDTYNLIIYNMRVLTSFLAKKGRAGQARKLR
jgi:hypothetical protein